MIQKAVMIKAALMSRRSQSPFLIEAARRGLRAIPLVLLFFCLSLAGRAQQTTGTISGNVLDTTGAAIGGATVNVTNNATNATRTTITNSVGQYTLPALPAGIYSLSVEAQGFQKQKTDSLVLDASQTGRQDFQIAIGQP